MKIIKYTYGTGKGRLFYRGVTTGEDVLRHLPSYWGFKEKVALEYAKLRHGGIVIAELKPRTVAIGDEPDLAKYLGIYDKYIKLRVDDQMREASTLVSQTAKRHGIDARVDDNQVAVFNSGIIKIKSDTRQSRKSVGISRPRIRITPKMPRIS